MPACLLSSAVPLLRLLTVQAAAVLFVCEVAADCHSALGELDGAVSDSERCVLHLDGRHLGDDRGALQVQCNAALCCGILRRCG